MMHSVFPTLPIHTPHGVGAAISTLWCRTSAAVKSGIPALPILYSQGFTLKCRSVPHISLLTHARRRARTRTQESVCAQWEVPRHCAALRHRHLRAHRTNHTFSYRLSRPTLAHVAAGAVRPPTPPPPTSTRHAPPSARRREGPVTHNSASVAVGNSGAIMAGLSLGREVEWFLPGPKRLERPAGTITNIDRPSFVRKKLDAQPKPCGDKGMGTYSQLITDKTRCGHHQSSDSGRSVATQSREHGQDMDGALPVRTTTATGSPKNACLRLAQRGQEDGDSSFQPGVSTAEPNRVETMGIRTSQSVAAVAGKVPDSLKPRRGRRRSGSDGSVNQKAVLMLLESQQYRCALTGQALTPELASLDHIIPVCRGGQHHIENTQVLERNVNRAKGTLTNEEFIKLCGEVWCHTQRLAVTENQIIPGDNDAN